MRYESSNNRLLPLRPQRHGRLHDDGMDRLRNDIDSMKQELVKLDKRNKDLEIELGKEKFKNAELMKKIKTREAELLQSRRLGREKEKELAAEKAVREQKEREHYTDIERMKGQLNYYKSRLLVKNASENVAQRENPRLRQQITELRQQISKDHFRRK